jgi:hypothetical protein
MANDTDKPKQVKISDILSMLSANGGVAISNTYKVTFEQSPSHNSKNNPYDNPLIKYLKNVLPSFDFNSMQSSSGKYNNPATVISLMCDEASLPGVQLATGQLSGIYTGSGQYLYPHTRIFDDLTLSWICDANMTPLKFLTAWMQVIANEYDNDGNSYNDSSVDKYGNSTDNHRSKNRTTRLSYPDDYVLRLNIQKAEKNADSEIGRDSIRYIFDRVFPYSIDNIPLSFGSSQLVKISANFYYEKWWPFYSNIRSKKIPSNNGTNTTTYSGLLETHTG